MKCTYTHVRVIHIYLYCSTHKQFNTQQWSMCIVFGSLNSPPTVYTPQSIPPPHSCHTIRQLDRVRCKPDILSQRMWTVWKPDRSVIAAVCGYTHATDNAINLLGELNEALMAARYTYIIMGTHTMDDTIILLGS